jgi:hypothetical protein
MSNHESPSITSPIEAWVDENADQLRADIVTHLRAYGISPATTETLIRMIMCSVRQWSNAQNAPQVGLDEEGGCLDCNILEYILEEERKDYRTLNRFYVELNDENKKLRNELDVIYRTSGIDAGRLTLTAGHGAAQIAESKVNLVEPSDREQAEEWSQTTAEYVWGLKERILELEAKLNQGEANSAENAKKMRELEAEVEKWRGACSRR